MVVLVEMNNEVFSVLKSFFMLVQTQFNKHVKRMRSDKVTEFFNNECDTLFKSLVSSMRVAAHTLDNKMEWLKENTDTYLKWL